MDDAQYYCAVINLVCFVIFGVSAFIASSFPGGGGRRLRLWSQRRRRDLAHA